MTQQTEHWCSLCGKSNRAKQVANMVAGPEGFICDECVAFAAEAMAGSNREWRDRLLATLTKLRETE